MANTFDLTRRGALASFGASAFVTATPSLAAISAPYHAGPPDTVALVWEAFHRHAPDAPRLGDRVELRAEAEPYMPHALAAYTEDGLALGYIAPRKAEPLLAALSQGATIEARISAMQENEAGYTVRRLQVETRYPLAV